MVVSVSFFSKAVMTDQKPIYPHSIAPFYQGAAESLIRTDAEHDRTNGFFVACIARIGGAYDHDQAEQIAPEKPVLAKRKPRDGELDDDVAGEVTIKPTRKKKKRKKLTSKFSAL